jgi:hypothetical protein
LERQTANYIADMILELRNLAKGSQMLTLQGLLEISYYEAYSVANRIEVPEQEFQHLQDMGSDARKALAAIA